MSYQVLARKWRPHTFTEVIGQDHVVKALTNALKHDRMHHAYLFTGTRGVGKTTIARILAKALNCESRVDYDPCGECSICLDVDAGRFIDLIEVDAASRTKVEDTRELLDNIQYAPAKGRFKIYLIDEVHMFSGHSFNALLKTLEEPPPHVKFLLATTDPQKIPVTVLSRCLQFNLKCLLPDQIARQMKIILDNDKVDYDGQSVRALALAAQGSMRDGLSLLDQAIVYGAGQLRIEQVDSMLGTVAKQPLLELLNSLATGDAAGILDTVNDLAAYAPDFAKVLQKLLLMLHNLAIIQTAPEINLDEDYADALRALVPLMDPEDVQLYYQIALIGQRDLQWAPDTRCGFEMVMLRMLAFKPAEKAANVATQGEGKAALLPANGVLLSSRDANLTNPTNTKHPGSQSWLETVAAMGITGIARELANNSILKSLDDKLCTLLLAPGHEQLHSKRVEERLQSAIQDYYKKPIKVVIEIGVTGQDTPAMLMENQREKRQQAAETEITEDANVRALAEAFDAKIIPGSTEPLDND